MSRIGERFVVCHRPRTMRIWQGTCEDCNVTYDREIPDADTVAIICWVATRERKFAKHSTAAKAARR